MPNYVSDQDSRLRFLLYSSILSSCATGENAFPAAQTSMFYSQVTIQDIEMGLLCNVNMSDD